MYGYIVSRWFSSRTRNMTASPCASQSRARAPIKASVSLRLAPLESPPELPLCPFCHGLAAEYLSGARLNALPIAGHYHSLARLVATPASADARRN